MDDKKVKKENKKLPEIDVKDMGVDIDKNEFREIVLSNSARPDSSFYDNYR